MDAAAAQHEQHVALAEQLFRTLLAEDRSAVDLRRHLEEMRVGKLALIVPVMTSTTGAALP